jgi:hypothetical protein
MLPPKMAAKKSCVTFISHISAVATSRIFLRQVTIGISPSLEGLQKFPNPLKINFAVSCESFFHS